GSCPSFPASAIPRDSDGAKPSVRKTCHPDDSILSVLGCQQSDRCDAVAVGAGAGTIEYMHQPLATRLEGIGKILMAHHAAGLLLPDAAKGTEREALFRDFFGNVFPPPFRFGSGAVIDNSGRMSGQLDIVAEFPFFPSFPTPGASERLYLAESVAFVIDVKSDLSKDWNDVE